MQKIFISGRLGRDPELRFLPDGKPVCSMSVASDDFGTTTWFRVSTFDRLAENCAEYLKKGRAVVIVGRISPDKETGSPRIWTAQDGTARAGYDVTASEVEFGSNNEQGHGFAPGADDEPF